MLVDAFAGLGFADVGAADREGVVGAVAASGPEAALGVQALRTILLSHAYTMIDATGVNPFWGAIGYRAPATSRHSRTRSSPRISAGARSTPTLSWSAPAPAAG